MKENPLGISTSWNAMGADDGAAIVAQANSLGFKGLEVEYRVSEAAVEGIVAAVRSGLIRVLSVHNYSPLLAGEKASSRGGDKRNLASLDAGDAAQAAALARRSVDLAVRLGASALVVHAGETDVDRAYFGELADAIRDHGVDSSEAGRIRDRVIALREELKAPYLDAAMESIRALEAYAGPRGIAIGVENRYYYHQVPLPVEIAWILEELNSPSVGYWHDVGHAHVMEVLGFVSHSEVLEALSDRMIGIHLHDSVFIRDHRPVGTGEIDFPPILEKVPPEAIRIVELAPGTDGEEIRESMPLLRELGLFECRAEA
jgi:sugar phosphate isomerase/epimerase